MGPPPRAICEPRLGSSPGARPCCWSWRLSTFTARACVCVLPWAGQKEVGNTVLSQAGALQLGFTPPPVTEPRGQCQPSPVPGQALPPGASAWPP